MSDTQAEIQSDQHLHVPQAPAASAGSEPVSEEYAHFFEVRLDLFDGPIDLLLHLVKQRELPIEKLSLAAVTEQYLRCIEQARHFDLEVAGEYLVIAATLLSIKSSILLDEPVELIEDEEGNLLDPHEELLRRLREAEVYKHGAFMLSCRKLLNVDVFPTPSHLSSVEPPPVEYKQHDAMLLARAFKKVLERAPEEVRITIMIDSVSIVERMMSVVNELKRSTGPLPFERLIPDLTSRSSVIASFLAILELCKRQAVRVRQEGVFERIVIALASEGEVDFSGVASEFDLPTGEQEGMKVNG